MASICNRNNKSTTSNEITHHFSSKLHTLEDSFEETLYVHRSSRNQSVSLQFLHPHHFNQIIQAIFFQKITTKQPERKYTKILISQILVEQLNTNPRICEVRYAFHAFPRKYRGSNAGVLYRKYSRSVERRRNLQA